jgi:hypothetical protein
VGSFGVDSASVVVTPMKTKDFILFLSDGAMVDRVLNVAALLYRLAFSLFFKRWTHLAQVDVVVLSTPIELELRGVPVHASEQSMVHQILNGTCSDGTCLVE